MTLTPEQIAAMRAAAEKATPGPWEWHTGFSWRRLYQAKGHSLLGVIEPFTARDGHPDMIVSQADMDFIAAANPSVVLALLDEVERLREALADAICRPMGVVPASAEGLLTYGELTAAEERREATGGANG